MEFRSEHGSHINLIWNLNGKFFLFFIFYFFEKLNGQKWNKKIQILVSGGMSYIKKISNLAEKKIWC